MKLESMTLMSFCALPQHRTVLGLLATRLQAVSNTTTIAQAMDEWVTTRAELLLLHRIGPRTVGALFNLLEEALKIEGCKEQEEKGPAVLWETSVARPAHVKLQESGDKLTLVVTTFTGLATPVHFTMSLRKEDIKQW